MMRQVLPEIEPVKVPLDDVIHRVPYPDSVPAVRRAARRPRRLGLEGRRPLGLLLSSRRHRRRLERRPLRREARSLGSLLSTRHERHLLRPRGVQQMAARADRKREVITDAGLFAGWRGPYAGAPAIHRACRRLALLARRCVRSSARRRRQAGTPCSTRCRSSAGPSSARPSAISSTSPRSTTARTTGRSPPPSTRSSSRSTKTSEGAPYAQLKWSLCQVQLAQAEHGHQGRLPVGHRLLARLARSGRRRVLPDRPRLQRHGRDQAGQEGLCGRCLRNIPAPRRHAATR